MHLARSIISLLAVPVLAGLASAHVRIDSPNGGEVIPAMSTFPIEWHDIVFHHTGVTYEIEYSLDSAQTWIFIVDNIPYTGGMTSIYNWQVPDLYSPHVRIRVTMHVAPGVEHFDVSNGDSTIGSPYMAYGMGMAVNGVTPTLQMQNMPTAGSSILLHVEQAQTGATAYLLVGDAQASFPFAGVTLLNNRNLATIQQVVDPNGEVNLPISLPSSAAGITVYVQVVIDSTPNLSATDGVTFTIEP
ncbi:MAG: hypothetical protein QM477_10515 [Planctomycetota bacterium]